jgi:hypothetical protein
VSRRGILALTAAGFIVTSVVSSSPAALADQTCADAEAYLDSARTDSRAGRWGAAGREARSAASRFDVCAQQRDGADYAQVLVNDAGARAIYGLSIIKAGGRRDNDQIRRAFSLYRYVAQYPAATSMQKQLAAKKAGAMLEVSSEIWRNASVAAVPKPRSSIDEIIVRPADGVTRLSAVRAADGVTRLSAVRPAGGVARLSDELPPPVEAPAPRSMATPSPAVPAVTFEVITTWQSRLTLSQTGALLVMQHVRLRLSANEDITVRSTDFRIVTTSDSVGIETVPGYPAQAPMVQRANFLPNQPATSLVPTIDPSEDLGFSSRSIPAQSSMVLVVSFRVRGDAQFDPNVVNAVRWVGYPRSR